MAVKKPRYIFLAFLLILLVVSALMALFAWRHADDFFVAPGAQLHKNAGLPRPPDFYRPPATAHYSSALGWTGTVDVKSDKEGINEITIVPVDLNDRRVGLTSFQVYLRSPDGKQEEDLTGHFTKDKTGAIKGTIEGKPAGTWLLRIRLHRALSTLEFTERVTLQ